MARHAGKIVAHRVCAAFYGDEKRAHRRARRLRAVRYAGQQAYRGRRERGRRIFACCVPRRWQPTRGRQRTLARIFVSRQHAARGRWSLPRHHRARLDTSVQRLDTPLRICAYHARPRKRLQPAILHGVSAAQWPSNAAAARRIFCALVGKSASCALSYLWRAVASAHFASLAGIVWRVMLQLFAQARCATARNYHLPGGRNGGGGEMAKGRRKAAARRMAKESRGGKWHRRNLSISESAQKEETRA